jgi:NADH-quinone oxidoreductase subunit J
MTIDQILFILVAAATLAAALLVVTSRNLIHAALWLIASLFGISIFYVFLNAGFLAVVQVVIYIGAIAILMIFAIMLTRRVADTPGPRFNSNWIWAILISVILFGTMSWVLSAWPGINGTKPGLSEAFNPVQKLGVALVSPEAYVIPFELASIMLLAALIGAIIVAWERD